MKNIVLVFSICCISLGLSAQSLNITLNNVSYKKLKVNSKVGLWYVGEEILVEENKTITVQGLQGEDDVFEINKNRYFVPKGESLHITMEGKELSISDDNMVAKENILLSNIEAQKNDFLKYVTAVRRHNTALKMGRDTQAPQPYNLDSLYHHFEDQIKSFQAQNPNCHPSFIEYALLDNYFFYYRSKLSFYNSFATFYEFSNEQLALLQKTIDYSDQSLVILSKNYQLLLEDYLAYLRINDPENKLIASTNYFDNEILLAEYFKSNEVKDFVKAVNLRNLALWNGGNPQYLKALESLPSIWREKIIAQAEKFKKGKGGATFTSVDFPEVSGHNQHGEPIALSDFKGKWVFIDIWATWCGPCKAQIPFVEIEQERLRHKNIVFLSISVDDIEKTELWKETIEEKEMTTNQMLFNGEKQALYNQFGISGIPHFALINPEGKLVYNKLPSPSTGVLDKLLHTIIEDKE